jgi:hypothetical protein
VAREIVAFISSDCLEAYRGDLPTESDQFALALLADFGAISN